MLATLMGLHSICGPPLTRGLLIQGVLIKPFYKALGIHIHVVVSSQGTVTGEDVTVISYGSVACWRPLLILKTPIQTSAGGKLCKRTKYGLHHMGILSVAHWWQRMS